MSPDQEVLLQKIMAAGSRRRRRGALAVSACLFAVAGVIGVAVANQDSPPDGTVAAAGEGFDLPGRTTATSLPPKIVKEEDAITTTSTTRPRRDDDGDGELDEPEPTTTVPMAELVCRNSTDERCGEFRWDPAPANAPLELQATASATEVEVGEELVLTVVGSDADAPVDVDACHHREAWGDGSSEPQCAYSCAAVPPRFGPWDPPATEPGRDEAQFRHQYDTPGVYEVEVRVASGAPCDLYSPYGSAATQTVTITVVEPTPPPQS